MQNHIAHLLLFVLDLSLKTYSLANIWKITQINAQGTHKSSLFYVFRVFYRIAAHVALSVF